MRIARILSSPGTSLRNVQHMIFFRNPLYLDKITTVFQNHLSRIVILTLTSILTRAFGFKIDLGVSHIS